MSTQLRLAAERIRRWREDPVIMVQEEFGIQPDRWQRKFLRAFASTSKKRSRIAAKACKGPGKTAVLVWCTLNFMACYGEEGEHPKGAVTSITKDNLQDNFWTELAKWQNRSTFFREAFVWTKTKFFAKDHPETWWMSARTWPKSGDPQQQADTLAGLHAKYILFILDESGGIPRAVMATAEAALANEHLGWAKILQAGNPTTLDGPLYDACTTESNIWWTIEITGDPDDPMRSPRISKKWARQQIAKYGRDNPWVLVNVFGKFPPASLNALLGPDDVEAAFNRHLTPEMYEFSQKRLGVDVARFGDDRTVLFPRQGLRALKPVILRQMRTDLIANRVMAAKQRWGWEQVFVDDTGHWGHGVIDNLIGAGYAPVGIQFHGKANDERYANRRAEMWIEMAKWVKRGGVLPNVEGLKQELTAVTYTFDKSGRFLIEDKDLIKEKIGRSPDLADALALTFCQVEMPKGSVLEKLPFAVAQTLPGRGKTVTEMDPFENVTNPYEVAI